MRLHNFLLLLAVCSALASGCRTLDPAGAYHGDSTLYTAESTLADSYRVIDAFLSYELAHRGAVPAKVTAVADELRRNYPKWNQTAEAAIAAYRANPSADNKLTAERALAVIAAAVADAASYSFNPSPAANPTAH